MLSFFRYLFLALMIGSVLGISTIISLHGMAIGTTVYIQNPNLNPPDDDDRPSPNPGRPTGGGGGGPAVPGQVPGVVSPVVPSDGDQSDVDENYRICQQIFDVDPQVVVTVTNESFVCVRANDVVYRVLSYPNNASQTIIRLIQLKPEQTFILQLDLKDEYDVDVTSDFVPDLTFEALNIAQATTLRIALYDAKTDARLMEMIQLDINDTVVTRWSGVPNDLHKVEILDVTEKVLIRFSDTQMWTLYTRQRDGGLPFLASTGLVQIEAGFAGFLNILFGILLISGLGYFHVEALRKENQQ